MAESQESLKTYRGNCHCGAFVFEMKIPEIKEGYQCNCSVCVKKGYIWTYPGDHYTVVKGDEKDLQDYTFNKGAFQHKFCSNCGTGVMARSDQMPPGKQQVINIRTIQGPLDLSAIERKTFDGRALPGDWKAPEWTGPEPENGSADSKVYHGSCHCGAVTIATRFKPLETLEPAKDEDRVVECNCSICQRGGFIWIYPNKDQTIVKGEDNLKYYLMGKNLFRKGFCKTCGVQIMNSLVSLSTEDEAALPEELRRGIVTRKNFMPINARVFDDYDAMTLKPVYVDGYTKMKPLYVNP